MVSLIFIVTNGLKLVIRSIVNLLIKPVKPICIIVQSFSFQIERKKEKKQIKSPLKLRTL